MTDRRERGAVETDSGRPRLAALVTDPERIADVEPEAIPALIVQLASVQAQLAARLLESPPDRGPEPRADAGDLLRVEEAAKRLNVSKTWLYRRINRLPFVVRLDRGVRVSAAGLERYLRAQQGRRLSA